MRGDALECSAQVVLLGRVEVRTAAGRVLADEDLLRLHVEQPSPGRGVSDELDVRPHITLVETVEVDLEDAPRMGLIVRMVVERHSVDLDGAVVAWRIRLIGRWLRQCDGAG